MTFDLIVVGGGAAGFFGAIQAAELRPGMRILILEKTTKVLTKVKVSGGGRCNVTHASFNPFELAKHYPRGGKFLKNLLKEYHATHVVNWFQSKGVTLKTEQDGRMFPTTDDSQTVVNCLLREAGRHEIGIEYGQSVSKIVRGQTGMIEMQTGTNTWSAAKCLIAIGGQNKLEAYQWLVELGHTIRDPIPSLFTFNDRDKRFTDLMGISIPAGDVRIQGTRFMASGPVLITHWGLSGPAVIRLSAWAAEYLHQEQYRFNVFVNWTGGVRDDECRNLLVDQREHKGKQKIFSNSLFGLPSRLWQRLCELSEIGTEKIWSEISNKELNRLVGYLVQTEFHIQGKTTFKEEFVTCGGINLAEVDLATMESKIFKDVYFAGEVLNIDGETGGFNFQNAWSTGYSAARAIAAAAIP